MEKPTLKQRIDGLVKFIYNSEKGEVLGRGARSWAEIGVFYLIYYSCLAAFFAATIAVFYQTIDSDNPRLQGEDSLLKGNPGMGFQPMPDIDTTLIRILRGAEEYEDYKKAIAKIMLPYEEADKKAKAGALDKTTMSCEGIDETRPDADKACRVNFDKLTAGCNDMNDYGMGGANQSVCVLLKLNKIYGWTPKVWESKDKAQNSHLPEDIKKIYTPDRIWVKCDGENPADKDNIGRDEIEYYPMQGFPLAFYPYKKQEDYMSPLLFVKFPGASKNLGLMIECKAYAKNIALDREEKEGSVHFELLLDN